MGIQILESAAKVRLSGEIVWVFNAALSQAAAAALLAEGLCTGGPFHDMLIRVT